VFPAVRGEVQKPPELLREGGCPRHEFPVRLLQRRLLLRREPGLELGEPISNLQHLQVLGTAHVRMPHIHAVVCQ
jgi:hypothetical protein